MPSTRKINVSQQYSPQFLKILDKVNKENPGAIRLSTGKSDKRRIPTGYFEVDRILGGGLPVNRITLAYGPKGGHKTTLGLKTIANWQKLCGLCLNLKEECVCPPLGEEEVRPSYAVYIDTEHALDEGHAARLGVDWQHLIVCKPEYGEKACEYAENLVRLPDIGIVMIDSLSDLMPQGEYKSGYLDGQSRGARAKLIARMTRAMVSILDNITYPRLCIMINHMLPAQDKLGWVLPGGEEQKYQSSVVLRTMVDNRKNRLIIDRDGTVMEVADSDAGNVKPVVKTGPREQDLRVWLEHCKVGPGNINVEFTVYLEEFESFRWGDCDDRRSVFLSAQRLGWVYQENTTWIDRITGFSSKTQKALFQHWIDNQRGYEKLKAQLISGERFKEE